MTPAFATLLPIVERLTGRRVEVQSECHYDAPPAFIVIGEDDTEGLLHELAHWVMAGPARRDLHDWGVGIAGSPWGDREERMCGWLQQDLCARAGIERPQSSVDAEQFWRYPEHRPVALARWHRYVRWPDRLAVIEALRLPGGDVGLWRDR